MGLKSPTTNSKSSLSNAELQQVLELCRKMVFEHDPKGLFVLIAREAARLLDAQRATIFLLDKKNNELWSQVALNSNPIRFDARLGIAGATVLSGQIHNVPDVQTDPEFYPRIDARSKFQTKNMLAIPLRTPSREVIGVLQVLNKKRGNFSSRDEAIAHTLAEQAASALSTAQLLEELQRKHDELKTENTRLWKEINNRFGTQNLLGNSPQMQGIVRLIDQIQDGAVDVLIIGESGTGKELVAKAIHYNSPRAREPFIALNCAALPDSLIETELFGIEKGVATGVDARVGKFEQAHGGTLFLDEIGEMGIAPQAKLLRVLQERTLERLGGKETIPLDVRIVAATNQDLLEAIAKGTFRKDLYYRLRVVQIHTPALREIPEDIPQFANYFLAKYCQEMKKEPKRFASKAIDVLQQYEWPGNIRQLENEIRRLVVTVYRTTISENDLDEDLKNPKNKARSGSRGKLQDFHKIVAEVEEGLIRDALEACHHNQVQTAKALGLSRSGLMKKMKRYTLTES